MTSNRRIPPPWVNKPHPYIPKGVPVLSRNGTYRGRSQGLGQICPAKGCIATFGEQWQLAVYWESSETTVICPVGWVETSWEGIDHIKIIAGGEITARYVTPRDPKKPPSDREFGPLSNEEWAAIGWNPAGPIANHRRPEAGDELRMF